MGAILHSSVAASPLATERLPNQYVQRDRYSTNAKLSFFLKKLRIRLIYLWRHQRLPDLTYPTLFTEFVQIRKLSSPSYFISDLIDKISVKNFVAAKIG